ncbi:hypothetical protein Y1Q_0007400 [Alligator mississippiensis]|uniref:Uncharacterized protein n=1 Tax=Alligator mississippiensis TaxID=8496 RepID=A0A151P7N8_ALLMI|nr:hypothetical protein Y1Q_0007400 [Alligator mississippiensis]
MLNPESTGNDYGAASCSTDQENIDLEAPVGVTPEQSIQGAVHGEVLEWLFTCYHELHNLGDEAANETFCIVIPMCAPVLKSLFLSKKQQVHTSMPSGNV